MEKYYFILDSDVVTNGSFKYTKKQTDKFGLLFEPQLTEISNDQDHPNGCPNIVNHFDENTVKTFENIFLTVKDKCKNILEIGVDHTNTISSTSLIFKNKNKETLYLGVDIDDKSYLNDENNNVHTL